MRTSLPKRTSSSQMCRLFGTFVQCINSSAYRLAQAGLADLGMYLTVCLCKSVCVKPDVDTVAVGKETETSLGEAAAAAAGVVDC